GSRRGTAPRDPRSPLRVAPPSPGAVGPPYPGGV
ncbi:MAG: hypothetical protein AVDCRST_MAG30-3270, partial [uncultured Solirubrobacteraceae bacterium]